MQAQASSNVGLRTLNALVQNDQLSPSVQPSAQLLNLTDDRAGGDLAVQILLGRGILGLGEQRRIVFAAGEGNPRRIEVQ